MKTYAQENKEKNFDWNKFLNKGKWSQTELCDAAEKAANWVTCACGNQCAVIPRDRCGEPFDFKLKALGVDFSEHIDHARDSESPLEHIAKARKVLDKIEKRSTILINQIRKMLPA